MKLDPAELRAYAARDWEAPARLSRAERASRPIAEKVALAVALFEAARRTQPGWPDNATRRADLAHHEHLRALLDRAAHVAR